MDGRGAEITVQMYSCLKMEGFEGKIHSCNQHFYLLSVSSSWGLIKRHSGKCRTIYKLKQKSSKKVEGELNFSTSSQTQGGFSLERTKTTLNLPRPSRSLLIIQEWISGVSQRLHGAKTILKAINKEDHSAKCFWESSHRSKQGW